MELNTRFKDTQRFRLLIKRGTQVLYVPDHVIDEVKTMGEAILHKDVEFGFITSSKPDKEVAYVRYWSKVEPRYLRTTTCSESTDFRNLWPFYSRPHTFVAELLAQMPAGFD